MYAYIPQVAEKMSCLLPQFKCLPDTFPIQFKTQNGSSSQLPKCGGSICFRTRCVLSTTAPPVSTESTLLNLKTLQLSSLEISDPGAAERPWSLSVPSTTAALLDMEKFQLPSLEAHSNAARRPWTYTGATGPPVEGDIATHLPSESLTSEDAVITAAAAEAVALAKAAVKAAKDAAGMVSHRNSMTVDLEHTPSLSDADNIENGTLSRSSLDPTNEELKLLELQFSASIAVRSTCQEERKARRARAAERAAASVVSVKCGTKSRRKRPAMQKVDFSDSMRYLRVTTNSKLLTAREERELSVGIQDLLKLQRVHDALAKRCGTPPSFAQWASAAGVDEKTLSKRLTYGSFCKDKMVRCNVGLVISIAKDYQGAGMHIQDLVQEGCRGLIRGAEKFDGTRGFKFSTYAHWWIRQAVRKTITNNSRTIRIPVHMVEACYKVKESRKQFFAEHGREPEAEELAEAAGITMKRLTAVLDVPQEPTSLDRKIGNNGDLKPVDILTDPGEESLDDMLLKQCMLRDLEKLLNTLNPREQQVVRWRYGLGDGRKRTLQDIGQVMGVSRERIRQIESTAFRKLKSKRNKELQEQILSYGTITV